MKKFGIWEVAVIVVGTALFVVLTEVQVPLVVVSNISLQIRAALLAFIAAVFGPVIGGAVGLIGHALGDLLFYDNLWWSWTLAEMVLGIAIGVFARKFKIRESGFGKKEILYFNIVQLAANLIAWIGVAPVLDVLLYKEDAAKVFEQGTYACLADVIVAAVLGTLLNYAYAKIGANLFRQVKK